jgi:hypothetical protein
LNGKIAVVIYDKCTLASGQITNPSLRRTTLHETGHGFALAIAKNAGNISNSPDTSTGWLTLMTNGINKLTPPQWTNGTWSIANKNSYLCTNVFGNYAPSALELDFGSTPGAVCVGGTAVDQTFAKTPRQLTEDKAPYFVKNSSGTPINGSNKELWAQLFAIRHDPSGSVANFLQLTDSILGYGSYTSSTANFQCLKLVMQFYYTDVAPPTSADLTARGCPASPGSFVTH